ncbi:hypothetical protein D3C71_1368420 [compost metagenome]
MAVALFHIDHHLFVACRVLLGRAVTEYSLFILSNKIRLYLVLVSQKSTIAASMSRLVVLLRGNNMKEKIRILSGNFNPRGKVAVINTHKGDRVLYPDGLVKKGWVGAYGRVFWLWHPADKVHSSHGGFDEQGKGHNSWDIAVNYEALR